MPATSHFIAERTRSLRVNVKSGVREARLIRRQAVAEPVCCRSPVVRLSTGHLRAARVRFLRCTNAPPRFSRRLDQLECEAQEGGTRDPIARAGRSMSNGGKGRLDGVGRSQMLPVFGRKVIEGERLIFVFVSFSVAFEYFAE